MRSTGPSNIIPVYILRREAISNARARVRQPIDLRFDLTTGLVNDAFTEDSSGSSPRIRDPHSVFGHSLLVLALTGWAVVFSAHSRGVSFRHVSPCQCLFEDSRGVPFPIDMRRKGTT